jgi:hypothetical protein
LQFSAAEDSHSNRSLEDIVEEAKDVGVDTTDCGPGDEKLLQQFVKKQKAEDAGKRTELLAKKISQLRKAALAAGADPEKVEKTDDFQGNRKLALTSLIIKTEKNKRLAVMDGNAQLAADTKSCSDDGMEDPSSQAECEQLCTKVHGSKSHSSVWRPLAPRCVINTDEQPDGLAVNVGYCFWNGNTNAHGWHKCGYGHFRAVCKSSFAEKSNVSATNGGSGELVVKKSEEDWVPTPGGSVREKVWDVVQSGGGKIWSLMQPIITNPIAAMVFIGLLLHLCFGQYLYPKKDGDGVELPEPLASIIELWTGPFALLTEGGPPPPPPQKGPPPPPLAPPTPTCEDKGEHCAHWKSAGHCNSSFQVWMKTNCCKTCR